MSITANEGQLERDPEGQEKRDDEADVVLRGQRDDDALAGQAQQQPAGPTAASGSPARPTRTNSAEDTPTKAILVTLLVPLQAWG